MRIHEAIHIHRTEEKGNGVYTRKALPKETIIEVSPVIVMTADERTLLDQTLLHDYIFEWGADGEEMMCCMAQGYISVYNHSPSSNCEYFMDYQEKTIMVMTMRDIAANEELTVNYNGNWDNNEPVWFEAK